MSIRLDPAVFDTEVNNKIFACICLSGGLEGDVAAVGGMDKGGYTEQLLAFLMANATQSFSAPLHKKLHLFGRYASHAEPLDPVDAGCPFVMSGRWRPGHYDGPEANALRAMCATHLGEDKVHLHLGPIESVVTDLPARSLFCLLYMNSRLYGPTYAALERLFSQAMVGEGCLILFADWNANRASPRYGERRAWAECVEKFGIEYSDGGAFGLSSHMMIVHDYRGAPTAGAKEQ